MNQRLIPQLPIIGRAERIMFAGHDQPIPAKIDTGADVSSIWASGITKTVSGLSFTLFASGSKYYSGEVFNIPKSQYRRTLIANSFGHKERRYAVQLAVAINGVPVMAEFTLADRSNKTYPVLLGRQLLENNFLVDVSQGTPLLEEEAREHAKLKLELNEGER